MKVPILLYHAIFENELNREKYAINRTEFEQQMKYLLEYGFQSLLLEDFFKTNDVVNNNKKPVIITFDDGNYSDFSLAFPILKKYGLIATFFVTVSNIGNKNYVSWQDLREMKAANMAIQSHSLNHFFLSDLKEESIFKELNESKRVLENMLKGDVRFISLPGGFFSRKVLNMAKNIGYRGVCSSIPGINILDGETREFAVFNRFLITRGISIGKFKPIVNGNWKYRAECKIQYYIKAGMKKILGSQRYYSLWFKFFRE
jgi:peptidoglycan/xylan/chitin deacetylase (PgdA/CDA1 family)